MGLWNLPILIQEMYLSFFILSFFLSFFLWTLSSPDFFNISNWASSMKFGMYVPWNIPQGIIDLFFWISNFFDFLWFLKALGLSAFWGDTLYKLPREIVSHLFLYYFNEIMHRPPLKLLQHNDMNFFQPYYVFWKLWYLDYFIDYLTPVVKRYVICDLVQCPGRIILDWYWN